MRNTTSSGNTYLRRALKILRDRLPRDWAISADPKASKALDGVLILRAPDGRVARLVVETKKNLPAVMVGAAVAQIRELLSRFKADGAILVTDFVTPLARERLEIAEISYLDLTGNMRVSNGDPALFLETRGAEKNPSPNQRDSRTLKGAAAARIVRALCDFRATPGVRELARRANTNPGYVSRILTLLEREDTITRDSSGSVSQVKWRDLIRRWTQDYSVTGTNRVFQYLAPRGLEDFSMRVVRYPGDWAITGSRAVPREAAVAPSRLMSCYVDDCEKFARQLDLRPAETGNNVLLIEPFDSVVWERIREDVGLKLVAVSQCAADLITGSGREPSEADALFKWMERHESAWRS